MNRFTHEFHTNANDIRLTGAERRRIHAKLREAMHTAPVPSPFFFPSMLFPRFIMAALALVIIVGGLGGTAYAAAGTVPGDILYPIKISVAEPIEGALAFSDAAKTSWNVQVAQARLDEAQTLAARGDLTATTSAELAANFTLHADAVRDEDAPAFASLVTAKSAAILDAGEASGNADASHASGSLVLAIADHDDVSDANAATFSASSAEPDDSASPAPSAKMAVPMMMAFSAPAEATDTDSTDSDDDATLLATLSVEAHDALAEATSTASSTALDDDLDQEISIRIAGLAKLVVQADAERLVGSTTAAVDDFNQALKDAADFQLFIESGGTPSEEPDSADADQPPLPTLAPFPI